MHLLLASFICAVALRGIVSAPNTGPQTQSGPIETLPEAPNQPPEVAPIEQQPEAPNKPPVDNATSADANKPILPENMPPLESKTGSAVDEYAMVMASVAAAKKPSKQRFGEPYCIQFEGLGTFCRNGSWAIINRLPRPPAELQTKFWLVTSASQAFKTAELLDYTKPETISKSSFDPNLITRVFTHGFMENGEDPLIWKIRDLMFLKEKVNFIISDWGNGARPPDYWRAAGNTPLIGAQLAKTIQQLVQLKGASTSKIELIGYSLGAQVSAFTAARLKEYGVNTPIKKITALDPAGPLFEGSDPIARLSPDDAEFVQVIHANGAGLLGGGLGMYDAVGHLDFYPNGGQYQPGCSGFWGAVTGVVTGGLGDVSSKVTCNHWRPIQLYWESFAPQNCKFESYPCDSFENFRKGLCRTPQYNNLGSDMDFYYDQKPSQYKQYYMTSAITPYCSNHIFVSVDNPKTGWGTAGIINVTLTNSAGQSQSVIVLDNENFAPGTTAAQVAVSNIKAEDVVSATISYTGTCSWLGSWSCWNSLKLSAVHIESMDGSVKRVLCGISNGINLSNYQTSIALTVKNGDKC